MRAQRQTFGNLVRSARTSREWERPVLAEKLGISASYVGHIERDAPVPVSKSLLSRLKRVLRISSPEVPKLVEKQNVAAKRYARERAMRNRLERAFCEKHGISV